MAEIFAQRQVLWIFEGVSQSVLLDFAHCFDAGSVECFGEEVEWFLQEEGVGCDAGGTLYCSELVGGHLFVDFAGDADFEVDLFFVGHGDNFVFGDAFLYFLIARLKFHTI